MSVNVTWGDAEEVCVLDAVIVDLDGTMVHTIEDFAQAIARMLADLQLPLLATSDIEHMVGKGTEHLLRTALAAVLASTGHPKEGLAQAAEALFSQALQRYMYHYVAINGQYSTVYDGVAQGLQVLKAAGLRLACVTNKPLAFTTPLLAAKGLEGLFDVVFGGDSFERKKPDPLPLLKTCEALGSSPLRTLMIGDSSNDAQASRAAGCPVVLVTYGYNHGQPVHTVDADGFVDSIAQLRIC